jgi:hypothetical protein
MTASRHVETLDEGNNQVVADASPIGPASKRLKVRQQHPTAAYRTQAREPDRQRPVRLVHSRTSCRQSSGRKK